MLFPSPQITNVDKSQFRLVLEQKSADYLFPLETLTPDSESTAGLSEDHSEGVEEALPRSRLKGLKQMSVEKLQLLRRSLTDAKIKAGKRVVRPVTHNKGTLFDKNLRQPNFFFLRDFIFKKIQII